MSTSARRSGQGEVHLVLLPPATPSFKTLFYRYPLKLIPSAPHLLRSAREASSNEDDRTTEQLRGAEKQPCEASFVPLLFLLSYGGGLLPCDDTFLKLTLDAGTRLTLTTQGSTKIYISEERSGVTASNESQFSDAALTATQTVHASIADNACLLFTPDPVQPFAASRGQQTQIFQLAPTASLGLLDWVTEGRRARGECWSATSWRSKNEVWHVQGDAAPDFDALSSSTSSQNFLLVRDSVILDHGHHGLSSATLRAEGKGVFGTLILAGPAFESLGDFFVREFEALPRIGGRDWDDDNDDPKQESLTSQAADQTAEQPAEQPAEQTTEQKASQTPAPSHRPQTSKQWRMQRQQTEVEDAVLWTAAHVRGVVLVKFAAREVEGAKTWLNAMWRREGTIARDFGEGGLMCVR